MSTLEFLKTPEAYTDDIPLSLAIAAHRGTSFEPESRGEMVVKKEGAPQ